MLTSSVHLFLPSTSHGLTILIADSTTFPYRLRTRMAYVQTSEKSLEEKRQHCTYLRQPPLTRKRLSSKIISLTKCRYQSGPSLRKCACPPWLLIEQRSFLTKACATRRHSLEVFRHWPQFDSRAYGHHTNRPSFARLSTFGSLHSISPTSSTAQNPTTFALSSSTAHNSGAFAKTEIFWLPFPAAECALPTCC